MGHWMRAQALDYDGEGPNSKRSTVKTFRNYCSKG